MNKEYNPREKFMKVKKDRNKAKKRSLYIQEGSSSKSEVSQSLDEDRYDEILKAFMLMAIDNKQVESIN